jgi:hypothetical protein
MRGFQPCRVVVGRNSQPSNLGRPPQRPHAGSAESGDGRQPSHLEDRECRLNALGNGELFAHLFD